MDKIELLKSRRSKLLNSSKEIRRIIADLTDENSFVEISSYSFSDSEFYPEGAEGEGAVCGFASIDGFPFYIAAQNMSVLSGGVSKANADKMLKCLTAAEKSATPVIYILSSLGIRVGEGITALEGMAAVLKKAAGLKGVVPQFALISGECYGHSALIASVADAVIMTESSVLAYASPFVLSAKSGKNLTKEEVGGAAALAGTNLVSYTAKNIPAAKKFLIKLLSVLPDYADMIEDYPDLNEVYDVLNGKFTDADLIQSVFDNDSFVELGADFSPEIKCIAGRIGGISAAATVFSDNGVKLNAANARKIKDFTGFASGFGIPLINFVNCTGIEDNLEVSSGLVLKNIADLLNAYDAADIKLSVVYGKACGAGYTLFAAKSAGYDYTLAFAGAQIALFDSLQGAQIEFSASGADKQALVKKYAGENSDPVNAAKGGFIDNIIEPALVKQHIIASLQMLLR